MNRLTKILPIFILMFGFSQGFVSAQTFDNEADWLASLCPGYVLAEEEYDIDVPDDSFGNPVDNPFQGAFGTFTVVTSVNNGVSIGSDEGLAIDTSDATLEPDGTLGLVNGLALCYSGGQISITVTFADGTTEVVTAPATADITVPGYFAWTNTSGQDVTSVVMNSDGLSFILCTDFAFVDELCSGEEDAETCQDLLDGIIADLVAAMPSGDDCDDWKIWVAICKLTAAQDDSYWVDGDRLTSAKGCKFFRKAKKAIAYLECTDTFDSSDSVAAINTLLSCVVDTEIQDAIDDGGNACWISLAEYYRDCADIYEAAGYNICAANLRKYAWYYARWS